MIQSKTSRRLLATAVFLVLLLATTLAALLSLLPWLGRRGDLNALIESVISSSLSVPVEIKKVETDTFSTFSVTHLRSVNARAKDRFHFRAKTISIRYDPTAILAGEIQNVTFEEPEIFINLDADLAGIAQSPHVPLNPEKGTSSADDVEYLLPFFVANTIVKNGNLNVRFSGRDLKLSGLELEVAGLGKALGQTFRFSVDVLGGIVRAWGGVDFLLETGKPRRYAFHSTSATLEDLEASRLVEWIETRGTVEPWLRAANLRSSGRLQLEGTLDGTWPEELTLELRSQNEGLAADFSENWSVSEADVSLGLTSTVTGDLESIAFELSTKGTGRVSSSRMARETHREDGALKVAGRFFREKNGGTLDLAEAKLSLAGIGRVKLSGTISSLLAEEPPEFDLSVDFPSLETRSLLGSLPASLFAEAIDAATMEEVEGDVDVGLQVTGNLTTPRVDGSLELSGASYPMASLDSLQLSFGATFDAQRRSLTLRVNLSAQMKEVLVGPFYADFEGGPATATATAEISLGQDDRLESLVVHTLVLETPFTGPVALSGGISRAADSEAFLLDAQLQATAIPGNQAFSVFVREPYAPALSFLEESELSGPGTLELNATGPLLDPLYHGTLSVGPADLTLKDFRLSGLHLTLPFAIGAPRDPTLTTDLGGKGILQASRVETQLTTVDRLHLPFRFTGESYVLDEPSVLGLLGGVLEITKLVVFPLDGSGDSLHATLRGQNLSVLQATRALGWPEIGGKLSFHFDPLILRQNRLESHGKATLKAFEGTIAVSDVTVDDIAEPYANMNFREGRIDQIRLLQLGNTFNFGLMSGVLDGTIKNLGFTGGDLTSFKLDVETRRVRSVPQFLNRQAIQSIQRIVAGPFGTMEESFFSKFGYSQFGFTCGLDNGIFQLQGKYHEGDTEYLMRGSWNQIPHINIINDRPGKKYDWYTIISSLRRIYQGETP